VEKTVEKTVEKIVEKTVEKTVEKSSVKSSVNKVFRDAKLICRVKAENKDIGKSLVSSIGDGITSAAPQ